MLARLALVPCFLWSLGIQSLDAQNPGTQSPLTSDVFQQLDFRHIGPGRAGGRISDVEALPDAPHVIFVAAATGGIFKTVNNGTTWRPVFDGVGNSVAIGDLAIAPSDPMIVWAGTGEASSDNEPGSIGDGVYKSIDGGETWQHMGLENSWHIARIVIDPADPNTVFVGVSGALWGPNEERGLYRTTNGGRTWERVLYLNPDTGIADVAIDPNGEILYASSYQRRRHAWAHLRRGPHSALYRSTDGGDTWDQLEGLPDGEIGRIALAIAPSDPQVVYAAVEASNGGWYRSANRGNSWERMSDRSTSFWYGRIFVNPSDADTVWSMGVQLGVSEDGGRTWDQSRAPRIHVDHHTVWFNPANTDHVLMGNDGGFHMTYDGGRNWKFYDNLPIEQFYAISIDAREDYWVYGGLQDNGTWGVASRTGDPLGILSQDTVYVNGGDGFYIAIDPRDHTVVYSESQNGGLSFIDRTSGERRSIRPRPDENEEEDEQEPYRFNWNSPLFLSPHDPDRLYFGGNRLFTTVDRGLNWEVVSPDLSRNPTDLETRTVMGIRPTLKPHATLTAIAESPLQPGLIYAGTDDGNVHVTLDGGASWQDLTERFEMPADRFVTRVLPSAHDAGTAYVAFTRFLEANDFRPYLFRTTDFGRSWTRLSDSMPDMAVIKGLAEHPRRAELLFAGVHNGLLISIDGGRQWASMRGENLPAVDVHDIEIDPEHNDLVLGTYGRGIVILDDIGFLESLDHSILESQAHLFPVSDVTRSNNRSRLMFSDGAMFTAPNPPTGASISYYLREDPPRVEPQPAPRGRGGRGRGRGRGRRGGQQPVEEPPPSVLITILNAEGQQVAGIEGPEGRGLHRVEWNLRSGGGRGGGRGRGRGGRGGQETQGPEEFTIRLAARGLELEQKMTVYPQGTR